MNRIPMSIRCGINIGNSLDCFTEDRKTNETSWNNPPITRKMIHIMVASGFDTIRIPVSWDDHFDRTAQASIDPAWMKRVREVVDWCLDEGATVILNTHHEFRWLRHELSQLSEILPVFHGLWQHIAMEFRDYDNRLILQGTNEPNLMGGENCAWGSGNRNVRAAINAVNHTFVRTVRETGGNNQSRWLCIPGLAARPLPDCMKDMIMPEDDHLIYTIHCYSPDRFVFKRDHFTDTAFFDYKGEDEVAAMFEDIERYALPHGCPVMITEWGAVAKRLPNGNWNTEERLRFIKAFMKHANRLDIPCVWWDNNYLESGDEYFGLFDREKLTGRFPELIDTLVREAKRKSQD